MTPTNTADVFAGVRDGIPALLGGAPYALVMGIAAVDASFSLSQAAGLSALVFAGLSQLAAVDLVDRGAPIVVIVATALIINARFVMYSASIAPHLEQLGTVWRWICPFFLVGPIYAIALSAFEEDRPSHFGWYFLGLALPSWLVWIGGTVIGMRVGAQVPDEWRLGFAVPLIFIAIATQFIDDRSTVVAALAAGVVAVVVVGLPFNLGLLVASAIGIIAGITVEGSRS